MKIVHISYVYIDGFNYQENELPKAHAQLGHEVTMISTQNYAGAINKNHYVEPVKDSTPYYIDGVKIIRLPLSINVDWRFSMLKDLYKTIDSEKPDLIFSHGGAYLNLLTVAKYKRKHTDCFWCLDFHGEYYNTGTNLISRLYHKYFFRYIIQSAFKYANVAYYITPLVGMFTEEMYKLPKSKLKMLPLGSDLSLVDFANRDNFKKEIRSKFCIKDDDIVIITGGRIEEEKNTAELVSAVSELNKDYIHLIIFGNIVDDYKEKLNEAIGVNPNIHIAGWLSPKEVNIYYLASDLACFPGGQSVLWQQAIGCGLPICVKYFTGLEYLDRGGNVKFIENVNVTTIKEALIEIVENRSLIKYMSDTAYQKGRDFFSYKTIAQTVIEDINNFC